MHVAVVADVDEGVARALLHGSGDVRQHVEAVDADLVGPVADLVPLEQLLLDVRLPGGGQERRPASPGG